RYYASWLNRWVSCDPVGSLNGPNLFVYARNNPLRFIDPSGTTNQPTPEEEKAGMSFSRNLAVCHNCASSSVPSVSESENGTRDTSGASGSTVASISSYIARRTLVGANTIVDPAQNALKGAYKLWSTLQGMQDALRAPGFVEEDTLLG